MSGSSPRTYPVIVTAGDRGRARSVFGMNKALLDLEGAPVFTHVLASLEACPSVDRIYMVGPKEALEAGIGRPGIPYNGSKPVRVFEQWDNLVMNVWNTFQGILRETSGTAAPDPETAVLVVPSDIPLVLPEEVEQFVSAADMERCDYAVGITSDRVLKTFHPRKGRSGIRLTYFHLREGNFRQNNLHMVKPLRIANRHYIQQLYDWRLQGQWSHVVGLFLELCRIRQITVKMMAQFMLLHAARILAKIPWLGFHRPPAFLLTKAGIEKSISVLLQSRFRAVETHFGGASLDIDTPEHFRAIQENSTRWRRIQRGGVCGEG